MQWFNLEKPIFYVPIYLIHTFQLSLFGIHGLTVFSYSCTIDILTFGVMPAIMSHVHCRFPMFLTKQEYLHSDQGKGMGMSLERGMNGLG